MVPENIRNVVLVGHGGSGKTSLAEALLFVAGATTRQGNVDDNTSILDHEPEEQDRKISINLAVASGNWNGHKINLIDAPGYADFAGDARSALRAADLALFVVSAVDGVEVGTELTWRIAAEEGIPRAVFITKMDRERASFQRTLSELQAAFGTRIAPIQVPWGEEHTLKGIARVITGNLHQYDGDPKKSKVVTEVPDNMAQLISETRTALIESVVETDEELMNAYFEGVEPDREVIIQTIHKGISEGEIFPVLAGSASKLVGIDLLFDFLVDLAPNPLERVVPPLESGSLDIQIGGPAVATVFKTISDPYVGKVSLFRVFSGSFKHDDTFEVNGAHSSRMHNLFYMQGKEHTEAQEVVCGDIAAIAKVDHAVTGTTVHTPGAGVRFAPVAYPKPVMEVAITPRSSQDEEKLSQALQKTLEEDPTLAIERRSETHEMVLSGLGDTHLDVTLARIARKFGVQIDTSKPKIPYRETISATAEVEGKHKKQSGGRGQFGVAIVRFAPRPRGHGFEFIDSVKGGTVPRQFIPAVEKGVIEGLERGMIAGYPVVDIAAELIDGKYHPVDSDELSFRMAGIQAVKAAADKVQPILLEPIMKITIRVPEDHTGDVMGDINSKRGRVLGMDSDGSLRVINAEVPMSESQRYAVDLRSMTSGRGTFEVVFDHYEEMPHGEAAKVIAAAAEKKDEH